MLHVGWVFSVTFLSSNHCLPAAVKAREEWSDSSKPQKLVAKNAEVRPRKDMQQDKAREKEDLEHVSLRICLDNDAENMRSLLLPRGRRAARGEDRSNEGKRAGCSRERSATRVDARSALSLVLLCLSCSLYPSLHALKENVHIPIQVRISVSKILIMVCPRATLELIHTLYVHMNTGKIAFCKTRRRITTSTLRATPGVSMRHQPLH